MTQVTQVVVMAMTLWVAMASSRSDLLDDLCPTICEDPYYINLLPDTYRHCHCEQRAHHTTLSPTTTTDVCDYLCSIQLGGQACECSRPSLPGRK